MYRPIRPVVSFPNFPWRWMLDCRLELPQVDSSGTGEMYIVASDNSVLYSTDSSSIFDRSRISLVMWPVLVCTFGRMTIKPAMTLTESISGFFFCRYAKSNEVLKPSRHHSYSRTAAFLVFTWSDKRAVNGWKY